MTIRLAADMVINAMISMAFAKPSRDGCLFRRFYPQRGIEGLLRPGSLMRGSRYERLYWNFYGRNMDGQLSTGETIAALKVLTPESEAGNVRLLGSHTGGAMPDAGVCTNSSSRCAFGSG